MSLTISKFIILIQVYGQIPELVDSVAQHCHQDPPPPPSNFHQTAILGVAYLRRLVGRWLQQFQASQQSPNIARGK